MIASIATGLHQNERPLFEWATLANGTLYTAQIPINQNGDVVEGGIEMQTRQTLDNLMQTLRAAGAATRDVAQVLIYVTNRSFVSAVNKVYVEYFVPPMPNRASFVVAGLAREEMLIEIVAYAVIPNT